jgi:hypothetical protein
MLGTTAATHADQTVAVVEPRFTRIGMLEEITKEIRSWPTNVYRRYVGDLSVAAQIRAIDAEGLSGVLGATITRIQVSPETANEETWPRLEGARMERRQNTTDFPSGYALIIPSDLPNVRQLRVLARAPFAGTNLGIADDFGSVGLSDDLVDIIPWGVVGRLLMTRDVARTDANAQGRSRPAEEVRGGDAVQVARAMLEERDKMLNEAANRLVAEDGMGWM